jgi:hypothetical protein
MRGEFLDIVSFSSRPSLAYHSRAICRYDLPARKKYGGMPNLAR